MTALLRIGSLFMLLLTTLVLTFSFQPNTHPGSSTKTVLNAAATERREFLTAAGAAFLFSTAALTAPANANAAFKKKPKLDRYDASAVTWDGAPLSSGEAKTADDLMSKLTNNSANITSTKK
jgi:hypothetical protein